MTISINPPPLQVPPDLAIDKLKGAFFGGLIQTLYQLWTTVYSLRSEVMVKTTDATSTALIQIPVNDGFTLLIEAKIVCRRTGGTSGTNGDSAWYVLTGSYKNVGGVLTGVGIADIIGGEDQAAWTVGFSSLGSNAQVVVQGAAGNDITWKGSVSVYEVGA